MGDVFSSNSLDVRQMPKKTAYEAIRSTLKTGDVVAFAGKNRISSIIKTFTRSEVSHVGVVVVFNGDEEEKNIMLIESTTLGNIAGVQMHWLSHRIFDYIGEVWHLPLSLDSTKRIDEKKFKMFLRNQIGKEYDTSQAIMSAIDTFEDTISIFENKEDYAQFFCSELVVAAFKVSGVLPESINASEITPIELCRFNIYNEYNILRGKKNITRFNTVKVW